MAVRMGFYTGKLYDSSVDTSTIKECCQVLNFKEPVLDDEDLVIKKRAELKQRCIGCNGCEESQKSTTENDRIHKRRLQVEEWNKRKDKHYYKVPMLNGGTKYVCMCEEMVKDFYGHYGYEKV